MNKHTHFIGIGGIGMSGIAQLLLCRGERVSGSDLKESKITQELKKQGADIYIGHSAGNIKEADCVVYSSAIKDNNPEILEARKKKIPLIKRAQALQRLMKDKITITVTGSHGKTTTTSLSGCLLLEAGLMPTLAIGGILKNIDNNSCMGEGNFFVAEADESDGSFLYYEPTYSIITNIDREHLDYYQNFANELKVFKEFIDKTLKSGCVFGCSDDANLKNLLLNCNKRVVLFGLKPGADIYARNIKICGLTSQFDCFYKDKSVERFRLALGGEHNISNALAVIGLGLELGIGLDVIKRALAGYKGARRRLEIKLDGEYLVIDDYAHHPTEIKASLAAAAKIGRPRIIAIFQPHRYTRTKMLFEEFYRSFDLADQVIITDIYAASEEPIQGVDARHLCAGMKAACGNKPIDYLPKEEIVRHILKIARPGDLIITLGAGDITRISDELAQSFPACQTKACAR